MTRRDRNHRDDQDMQRGQSRRYEEERGSMRDQGRVEYYDDQEREHRGGQWENESSGQGQRGRWGQGQSGMNDYGRGYGGDMGDMDQGGTDRMGEGGMGGPHTGRGPKGYQRADERIREDVCEALTQHGHVDASEIEIEVKGGEVTLTGTVDSRQSKRMAEDAIEHLSGVRQIHNHLRVGQQGMQQGQQMQSGQSGMQSGQSGTQQTQQTGTQSQQRAVGESER